MWGQLTTLRKEDLTFRDNTLVIAYSSLSLRMHKSQRRLIDRGCQLLLISQKILPLLSLHWRFQISAVCWSNWWLVVVAGRWNEALVQLNSLQQSTIPSER